MESGFDFLVAQTEEISNKIRDSLPLAKVKLRRFLEAFNEVYPPGTDSVTKDRAAFYTIFSFKDALTLYSLEMNGATIVELHSILERISVEVATKLLPAQSKRLQRSVLPDLASSLNALGVLRKDDVIYAWELNKLRNSVAHKNAQVLSNALLSGKNLTFLDIEDVLADVDSVSLLVRAISFQERLIDNSQKDQRA